jgi:hypothetical protein
VADSGFRGVILPPLQVSASDGEYADRVMITWMDQADNDSGYNVYRNDSLIATTDADVGSYEDSTAEFGTTYTYCVRTLGADSIESIPICDDGGRGILPAPAGVAASDSTYDDRIEITWQDPSALEDGFEMQRDGLLIDTTRANVTVYKDYTASPDTIHEYCVVAFSDEGGRSDPVCDSGFQSLVVPPFDVSATDGEFEDRTLITWKSTSTTAVLFKIFRDDSTFIKSVSQNARSYSDYGGTAGQEYDYSVTAVSALEHEATSEPDPGSRELLAPTAVTASDEEYEDKVIVTWTDNSQLEQGYAIYRGETAPGELIGTKGANSSSFTDFTGVPGVTYVYRVAAFDSLGEDYGESEAGQDQGLRVLLAPSGVQATDGRYEDQVEIFWTDNSSAEEGYRICRNDTLIDSTTDNSTSYLDASPLFGQASTYSVVAFDSYGESEAGSDNGSTTILAPGSFNASDVYEDRVELSWVDLSRVEDGYIISRDGVDIDTTGADATSYTDAPVVPDKTYEYCVRAVRSGDSSAVVCDYGQLFQPEVSARIRSLYTKLLASDPDPWDHFGGSVAISGDVAIVGASGDDSLGINAGAAYIFQRNPGGIWSQSQMLVADDPNEGDIFGNSVAISGDVAIIGASGDDNGATNAGAAYIFERKADGEWSQKKKLVAFDPMESDQFGNSVAIDRDVAVIGAYWKDQGAPNAGAAYIFERAADGAWNQKQKFLASDADSSDRFGYSVAVSGDVAVIGADRDDSLGINAGAAYIFERDADGTWPETETQKLVAFDPNEYGCFGNSVAIEGDLAIIGAPYNEEYGWPNAGAAYIFECNADSTWIQKKKLLAGDPDEGDQFGWSVAIDGDVAIIGAHYDDEGGAGAGAAYIFKRAADDEWSQKKKLVAFDPNQYGCFGNSVAIEGDLAIIGAYFDDEGGTHAGAAYLWSDVTVVASDGSLNSRVRINWSYLSSNQDGFHVYRDGDVIATVLPNVETYEDFEAQPGRTYEYCVAAYKGEDTLSRRCDFGWRPPNGNITGNVSTLAGAGVEAISVGLDPQPTRSLLLDGTGGFVVVPDREGIYNFNIDQSYTVEAWLKYSGEGGEGDSNALIIGKGVVYGQPFPFRLTNRRCQGNPGQLEFAISDGTDFVQVFTPGNTFNDGTWHHIACVHDADQAQILIYADGVPQDTTQYLGLGDITNYRSLYFGGGLDDGTWFGGQIDEVRIWNVARSADQINATMNRLLTGKEESLVGYWPLDEDSSSAITDFSGENHYGSLHGGVYWAEDAAPLDIDASSDAEGNYVLDKIRYGEETTFQVRPHGGERQFSPAFKTITLSTGHPVENQVNFVEITSFTVSGEVKFEGTDCGVQNAEIHVDGNLKAATDKNGKFAVAVDNGDHWVKPVLSDHIFEPDSVLLRVDGDTAGIIFTNTTVRALSGRVGGGCNYPVGEVKIFIRSENNCMNDSLTVHIDSTSYSIDLPPQKYMVRAEVVESTIPDGLNKPDVVKFFDNLGERDVDLSDSAGVLDFVYRAPLRVEIKGLENWVPGDCEHLTFNGNPLPDSLPVVPQLTVLELIIEVNEYYGKDYQDNDQLCPLDSGTVIIYDEIFDQQDTQIELVVRDGEAAYTTFASTPSLAAGRVDSDGNNRSFQKALKATVVLEGRKPVTASEWVLVTGHVAPPGSDFVTGTGGKIPIYILRDPPGDFSYAYLDSGSSFRTNFTYTRATIEVAIGVSHELKFGFDQTVFAGIGAGVITRTAVLFAASGKNMYGTIKNSENRTDLVLTTKQRFSTSADELFVGPPADVFVGFGYNMIFSKVAVVDVSEDCQVVRSSSVGFQPDTVGTIYTYTQQYIQDVLIPELDSRAQYYYSLELPDSADIFKSESENWQHMLALNDSLKAVARLEDTSIVNRSFSAGADFEYSFESDTIRSASESFTRYGDFSNLIGLEFEGGPFAGEAKFACDVRTESVPKLDESTNIVSSGIGYVLGDVNIGDHFTVDVMQDSRYPSPVFDVLGGVSSCPYEPWPDPETGEPRMMARDSVQLEPITDLESLVDLPPDEPAVINLQIVNYSPTHDTRIYELREVPTSNPYAAVIKGNGVWLYEGLIYYIDGDPENNTQVITLTVDRGPTRYNYDNLAVMVYPQCEWNLWERRAGGPLNLSDTLYFDVSFKAPCSDIRLSKPKPGWVFNKANEDSSLQLELTDYEIEISDDDSVESVGAQYRRLRTELEGPTEWTDIPADYLGKEQTTIEWHPDSGLADGVYELRAYTQCPGGLSDRGYSGGVQGTIDRNAPQVLGRPEPADGELSLGENISITFNEPIDCNSINADSLLTYLTYLDGPHAGDTIEVDWVCDGRTIVFTPAAGVDPEDLEGWKLQARVEAIRDLVGNLMVTVETWEFRVRQSIFTWNPLSITRDVAFRAPGSITADLVNGSDSTVGFTIISKPWWITDYSDTTGSIAPGGTQSISFAIKEDLARTTLKGYKGSIVADTSSGRAILKAVLGLYVTVSCHEPVWEMDPGRYEHTMTIVAEVNINDTISSDPNDRVAAFVGSQLRGVANIEQGMTGSYVAFLTVYSNRTSGETVRFQVWDADSCKLYNSTLERFGFVSNGMIGSPEDPVTLTATDVLPDTVQVIPLSQGWNWFSTNVCAVDMSPNGVLSDLTPEEGDIIKSQTDFATFDPAMGWVGELQLLDNVSSYMIRLSEQGTILQEGSTVPDTTPIPVADGWNWISYLPTAPLAVETALQDLNSVLSDGDMVKSQTAFAQRAASQWSGSLDSMEAGMGYKLYLQTAPASGKFYYRSGGLMAPTWAGDPEQQTNRAVETTESVPGWSVNQHAYQYNMTVVAALEIEGDQCRSDNNVIGAFVDGECRGLARPIYLSAINRYVAFLMIHSNEVTGETVEFQAFVPGARAVYNVAELITYEADRSVGTIRDPLLLSTKGIAFEITENVPATFSLSQNYPNPFNPVTTIAYSLPERSQVMLEIFNVLGQRVKTLVSAVQPAGRHSIVWDAKDEQGKDVASGIYFYRLEAGEFSESKKMVILK